MQTECVNAGWHGVPLPFLPKLLNDGVVTPWPGKDKDPNDLGLSWWGKDFDFAMTYGGPVEIGNGWMINSAVATLANSFLGPNAPGGRDKSYASEKVVLSGEVYVQASHIVSLSWGEGRYLPIWDGFPWEELWNWRRKEHSEKEAERTAKTEPSSGRLDSIQDGAEPSQEHREDVDKSEATQVSAVKTDWATVLGDDRIRRSTVFTHTPEGGRPSTTEGGAEDPMKEMKAWAERCLAEEDKAGYAKRDEARDAKEENVGVASTKNRA
jgi:hypothetical protein